MMRRIYVACLASYNAGILHGVWVNASEDVEEMADEITAMLKASKQPDAEEWRIDDTEGYGFLCNEPSLQDVADIESLMKTHRDEDLVEAAFSLADNAEEASRYLERFLGCGSDEENICREWLDESGILDAIPEDLRQYFDYDSYLNDKKCGGEWHFVLHGNSVYGFWSA